MTLDIQSIFDALLSHAAETGLFDQVQQHEPKAPPGKGLTFAAWSDYIGPASPSGTDITSALVVLKAVIYTNMLQEPQDAIDPAIMQAVVTMLTEYTGDFTLGGSATYVDLLGMEGRGKVEALAGYVTIGQTMYRCMTINLPVVVENVWTQTP